MYDCQPCWPFSFFSCSCLSLKFAEEKCGERGRDTPYATRFQSILLNGSGEEEEEEEEGLYLEGRIHVFMSAKRHGYILLMGIGGP